MDGWMAYFRTFACQSGYERVAVDSPTELAIVAGVPMQVEQSTLPPPLYTFTDDFKTTVMDSTPLMNSLPRVDLF